MMSFLDRLDTLMIKTYHHRNILEKIPLLFFEDMIYFFHVAGRIISARCGLKLKLCQLSISLWGLLCGRPLWPFCFKKCIKP